MLPGRSAITMCAVRCSLDDPNEKAEKQFGSSQFQTAALLPVVDKAFNNLYYSSSIARARRFHVFQSQRHLSITIHATICRSLIKVLSTHASRCFCFALSSFYIFRFVAATKCKTLGYLYSILGKATVGGVHNKHSQTPNSFSQEREQISGRTGLWSGDFLFNPENIDNRGTMVEETKRQWENGALVNIMWHACNPSHATFPCAQMDLDKDFRAKSATATGTDGTTVNDRWKQMMDDIAQCLEFLKDENGVEVMFRPLHEMNQGCFWWGGRPGSNGSRRLYQTTHRL